MLINSFYRSLASVFAPLCRQCWAVLAFVWNIILWVTDSLPPTRRYAPFVFLLRCNRSSKQGGEELRWSVSWSRALFKHPSSLHPLWLTAVTPVFALQPAGLVSWFHSFIVSWFHVKHCDWVTHTNLAPTRVTLTVQSVSQGRIWANTWHLNCVKSWFYFLKINKCVLFQLNRNVGRSGNWLYPSSQGVYLTVCLLSHLMGSR